jgi:leucyl-tRNA synthetase
LSLNLKYIERETETEVEIAYSNQPKIYDPKNKAKNALPFRPAIYLE